MPFNVFRICCSFLVVVLLSACVTTGNVGDRKIDKKKALEANIKLGMAYLQQDQRDNALRAFSKAIDADGQSAEAHMGIALVHQLNGEIEAAEHNFKKALTLRVDYTLSDIEFAYGRFLRKQNRCKEGMHYFAKASNNLTYPKRAEVLYFLGICALEMDDDVRAKGSFEHSLNLNRRFAPSAIELAHLAFAERDYANAKKYLDQFADNARHTPRSLWLGIRIERIFGNKDKEASYALALKNLHPYSQEYLDYKNLIESRE